MDKVVLAFSGSLRKESFSTKLLKAIGEQSPSDVLFRIADISKLPIYNQDDELPEPDFLLELKAQVRPAHGVLFVTPEYNRSIPPVLKNALTGCHVRKFHQALDLGPAKLPQLRESHPIHLVR